jgi:hypothetical protein
MQKKKDKNLMKTDVKPMKKRTAIPNIPSLLRWFQDDDPGQDALDHHPHQACHHLPGAQALLLSGFYQYEFQERRQGWLRIQGNSQQIRL